MTSIDLNADLGLSRVAGDTSGAAGLAAQVRDVLS
jgi:hypothetical protein